MNVLRIALSWISLYLVGTFFFLSVSMFVIISVFNAENIKQTLNEQGSYGKIVPAVLSTAKYDSPAGAGMLPLGETWVQEATKKAFSSEDLKSKGDVVIDSTFTWLDGKTSKPQFSLDFTENKERLGKELGNYTENRLNSLPPCTLANIPTTIDAFRINCLPFGVNPAIIGNKVRSDIVTSQDFLKTPVITYDSIQNSLGPNGNNQLVQLNGAGWVLENRGLLVWILPVLLILFAIIGTTLAQDIVKAIGRIGRTFIVTSVSLVAFGLFISFGFKILIEALARDAVSKQVIGPVFISLAQEARTLYLVFAGVGIVFGIVLLFLQRKLRNIPNQ